MGSFLTRICSIIFPHTSTPLAEININCACFESNVTDEASEEEEEDEGS